MSDEEISKLSRDLFRSKDAPELTDSEIEEFFSTPIESPPGLVEQVYAKFVAKVFADLHPTPVRSVREEIPLGRWIESVRKKARLTREGVATALGKDESFIERLETGDVLPWNLSEGEIADLANLFRIHKDAIPRLSKYSNIVNEGRAQLNFLAARSHSGRMSKQRRESVMRALDLWLAHNIAPTELSKEIIDWLDRVHEELVRRQATDLLR